MCRGGGGATDLRESTSAGSGGPRGRRGRYWPTAHIVLLSLRWFLTRRTLSPTARRPPAAHNRRSLTEGRAAHASGKGAASMRCGKRRASISGQTVQRAWRGWGRGRDGILMFEK